MSTDNPDAFDLFGKSNRRPDRIVDRAPVPWPDRDDFPSRQTYRHAIRLAVKRRTP